MQTIAPLTLFAVLTTGLSACGQKAKEGNSGLAKLALTNSKTGLNGTLIPSTDMLFIEPNGANPDKYTPSNYGVKMVSLMMVQGDGNPGNGNLASQIWINPDCTSAKQELESEVDNAQSDGKKTFKYIGIGECTDDKIQTFFNLARATEDVNKDLNSQRLPVLPGIYKKAAITFCIGGAKSKNIQFKTDGMTDSKDVSLNNCGVTSEEFNPALEIKEGESVTVSLSYDLSGLIYDYGSGSSAYSSSNCYKSDDGSIRRCVNFPTLKPSVTKN